MINLSNVDPAYRDAFERVCSVIDVDEISTVEGLTRALVDNGFKGRQVSTWTDFLSPYLHAIPTDEGKMEPVRTIEPVPVKQRGFFGRAWDKIVSFFGRR